MRKNSRTNHRSESSGISGEIRSRLDALDSAAKESVLKVILPLAGALTETKGVVESLSAELGLMAMKILIDDEVEAIAGKRYERVPHLKVSRWGSENGYVAFAGRKAPMVHPRLRHEDGYEVPVGRYGKFQDGGRLEDDVKKRIVRRVSTRNYAGVLDDVCDCYGIEKSSVSLRWKEASEKQVRELMERPLGDLNLLAILIDGIRFHEFLLVVALGVDISGKKHVLGLWLGATENSTVCGGLLDNLIERGLDPELKYVFIIDGSKSLKKAVTDRFGKDAVIQRCIVHKERNVLDYLPEKYHSIVRMKLRAAWNMKDYDEAKAELMKVVSYLRDLNESAAASLEEGLEETLTLHRLNAPESLRKSLRSTNIIESCFSTTRDLCRNVKRWRNSNMALRWGCAMLLQAEKRFRRIRGSRSMPVLAAALGRTVSQENAIDKGGAVA